MLSITRAQRYFIHCGATDMRKGFDGLSGIVRNEYLQNPLSGDVFIFLNQQRNRIKLLHWQGDGFAVFYKRLEKGTYELPVYSNEKKGMEISSQHLLLILEGIQLSSVKKRIRYQTHFVDKKSMESIDTAIHCVSLNCD